MGNITGYPDSQKKGSGQSVPSTVQPVSESRDALDVIANSFARSVASDIVEASSTTSVINATSHVALKGDIIRFTSGALDGREVLVSSVTTNAITLAQELPSAPAASDTFNILRRTTPTVSSDGTISTGPVDTSATLQTFGELAFGAISGTYATLLTPAGDYIVLMLESNFDEPIEISLDGGTTDHIKFLGGEKKLIIDFGANDRKVTAAAIQVRHTGVAPTEGSIIGTVVR